MKNDSPKYTIGQMAELCNISINLLRYYDANNILVPAYRNPKTNYRYYTENQIEEVVLLQELKKLDFSLKNISEMIAKRELGLLQESMETRLKELRQTIAETQAMYDKTIDMLLRVMNGLKTIESKNLMMNGRSKIEIVNFPERNIAYTRKESYCNAARLFISRRTELLKLINENELTPYGPNMAVFHSDFLKQFSPDKKDHTSDFEVCYSIRDKHLTPKLCRRFGGFDAVSAIHIGHYKYMKPKYLEMLEWAEENHIRLTGLSIEEYVVDATMTQSSEDYVTRLYLPVAGK